MTPNDRKAELIRAGVQQKEIAARLGLSRAYVSYVVAGKRRSDAVETLVAQVLGRKVERVFPPRAKAA